MTERIFLILDLSDDCNTEINVVDAPIWVLEEPYKKDALYCLEGTPILAVKEYQVLNNDVRHPQRFEDIVKQKRSDYIDYLKSDAKELRKFNLRVDKSKSELVFTCFPRQHWGVTSKLKSFTNWVERIRRFNKLIAKF